MEIRVLKYFLAVAREGSITGAANSLHLTQPTLTRQLKDLENELGHKLLIRGKYKVTLTQEGMILRNRAQEIVDMADRTTEEFKSITDIIKGDVYIGGGETRAIKFLTDIIKEIRQEYPDIKYHIYSGNAEDVTEKLDRGLLDFGVLIQPIDLKKYDSITLPYYDTWGVITKKDSILADKKFVTLYDLAKLPIIASRQMSRKYSKDSGFLDWFGDEFDNLDIVATYNLVYNAGIMVESGIGHAVSLKGLINDTGKSPLKFIPLKPKLQSGLDVVWKKYRMFSPAAKLFLDKLREKLK